MNDDFEAPIIDIMNDDSVIMDEEKEVDQALGFVDEEWNHRQLLREIMEKPLEVNEVAEQEKLKLDKERAGRRFHGVEPPKPVALDSYVFIIAAKRWVPTPEQVTLENLARYLVGTPMVENPEAKAQSDELRAIKPEPRFKAKKIINTTKSAGITDSGQG